MLYPGLYEQVINNALNRELTEIPEARKSTAPIDTAEAAKVLAQYLTDVVQKGLENVQDNGGGIEAQIQLANQIVTTIRTPHRKLTLPRSVLTSGQSSFLRFCSRTTRALLQEKAQKTLTARRPLLRKVPCLPALSMSRRCTRS